MMYTEGQYKAVVGRVSVDIKGKSYRLRFTYPEGNRHEFSIAKVSPEGWTATIKAAQLINRDIDLGDFDESYTRYSPKHAKKLQLTRESQTQKYNLKQLWEVYKESNKNRVATTTQHNSWKQYNRCLSAVSNKSLKLENSELFFKEVLNVYSVGTIKGVVSKCLHPSVNQAIKKGLIKTNPYKDIKLPKTQAPPIECFEPHEIKAIISAFYNNEYCSNKSAYKHSYYAPMIEFLALTGCRPEECHALTWNDIKHRNNRVFINFNKAYSKGVLLPHTKNHTIRLFPCNEQLQNIIISIPHSENKYNLVFPSAKSCYVDQDNFRNRYYKKVLKGLVEDEKVEKYLKPYALRHSFITRLVREGVDIKTVATLSGNSVNTIIKHYLASRDDFELPPLI